METFWIQFALAVVLSFAIALTAFKRKSLNRSGAIAGFLVMAIHLFADFRSGCMLLVFFFSSSKLTKVGEEKKRTVDEDFKEGGQRNWLQVLANSAIATILVIALRLHRENTWCLDTKESTLVTALIGGIIGHYACCNGDTWSSEIGVLSQRPPRLVTTFRKVRKGTNGAITLEGLLAAAVAGHVIGLTYVIFELLSSKCSRYGYQRMQLVILLATSAGLLGSLIDSFLGATLQYSGYCSLRKKVVSRKTPTVRRISGRDILDNNAVNAVSVLSTTVLTGIACTYIF